MKIAITLLFASWVFAINPGHCLTDYSSKRYIQNDFSAPYPKEVIFSCKYECENFDGVKSQMTGISTIVVNSLRDDAYRVVCQGVKVKKTSWGYDYDSTNEFYAHDTRIPEVKEWANDELPIYNLISEKYLKEFASKISNVAQSYLMAAQSQSPYAKDFEKAGQVLERISKELPANKKTFEEYRLVLEDLNAQTGKDLTAQKLILDQILYGAPWSLSVLLK